MSNFNFQSTSTSIRSAIVRNKPIAKNPCDICNNSSNEMSKYCIDCKQDLCYFCSKSHKNLKISAYHTIRSKDKCHASFGETQFQTYIRCLEKDHGIKKNFCLICEILLCDICPINNIHQNHTIIHVNLQDKKEARQNINIRLNDVKEKCIQLKDIIEMQKKEEQKMKKGLENLIENIMTNQEELNGRKLLQSQLEELLKNGTEEELIITDILSKIPSVESQSDSQILENNLRFKKNKKKLDFEPIFISQETLSELLDIKQNLNNYKIWDIKMAHRKINPYELIKSGPFINRSAMKIANIDANFDYIFTSKNDKLYFADICGGPGGFAEYIIWRRISKFLEVEGFGITFDDPNVHYRIGKYSNYFSTLNGNILSNETITEFKKFILTKTKGNKVDLAMADKAFELQKKDSEYQEIQYQNLILCQILTALEVLKIGGNFITNIFDIFTPFTANLVFILQLCFEQIKIIKPVTCRPANSERFIVCKNMKDNIDHFCKYLTRVNQEMADCYPSCSKSDQMITELMPFESMSKEFVEILKNSNEVIAKKQIAFLKKVDPSNPMNHQVDSSHADLSSRCMREWDIPDELSYYNINENDCSVEPQLELSLQSLNLD